MPTAKKKAATTAKVTTADKAAVLLAFAGASEGRFKKGICTSTGLGADVVKEVIATLIKNKLLEKTKVNRMHLQRYTAYILTVKGERKVDRLEDKNSKEIEEEGRTIILREAFQEGITGILVKDVSIPNVGPVRRQHLFNALADSGHLHRFHASGNVKTGFQKMETFRITDKGKKRAESLELVS